MSDAATQTPTTTPVESQPDSRRIDRFLRLMVERGASDLHLSVGRPPLFRLSGEMDPIRYRTLARPDFETMVRPITPPHLWQRYLETGDCDLAYQLDENTRFRVNLFEQERGHAAVFRVPLSRDVTVIFRQSYRYGVKFLTSRKPVLIRC